MKAFIKTLAISLSSLTLFCSFSIAQSSGNSTIERERAVVRMAGLSRSIERGSVRGTNTRSAAKERFALMRSLAETDPAAVVSAALSSEALARLPETSRKYFETRERVEGELEVIAECEEHYGRIEYFVKQGDTRVPLYFAGEPDRKFVSGKKISVEAVKLDDILVADADSIKSTEATSAATTTEASALTGTTGEKRVLVILVNFQDKQTQPFTVEHARNITFNTTSNYFYENSYGQTWLTGDVYGWYTIPVSSAVCDKNAMAVYGKQAAANAGANLSAYDHIVYGFPSNACTFAGSSTVGGYPSQSWVNHFYTVSTVGHELGHGLGLYHSRSLDCGNEVVGQTCTTLEYGNVFDIMGGGATAHMNIYQKERLGWLNRAGSPPIQSITASGTYWIDAYETAAPNVKGLKILKSVDPVSGEKTWYYLEHRTPTGFDSYLSSPNYNVVSGVTMHQGSELSGYENYLLDMTPATSSWYDPALVVGQTFADASAGISVTVISADNSGAVVQVLMNSQPCVRANPTVTITPGGSPWLQPGSSYAYQVTVRNNNSGGCATESFNLVANLPGGFTSSLSKGSFSLSNGAAESAGLNAVSSSSAPDGTYSVGVTASNSANSSFAGASSASYVVVSRINVSATPGTSVYSRSQTAKVTATVSAAGSPTSGASVTFTLTKPNGTTVRQTLTTGSDGRAIFNYKFDRKKDTTGTYSVAADAAVQGYSGRAVTSFSVNK
jgi:hypothetical protein